MTETNKSIELLINDQLHFGQIPDYIQAAIITQSKAEIGEHRHFLPRLDSRSKGTAGELKGPATQALLLGNMGVLRMAVAEVRVPRSTEDLVTGEDLLQEVCSEIGNYITCYDKSIGALTTYLAMRARSTSFRRVNFNQMIHVSHNYLARKLDKAIREKRDSTLEPLRTEDYHEVAEALSGKEMIRFARGSLNKVPYIRAVERALNIETLQQHEEAEGTLIADPLETEGRALFDLFEDREQARAIVGSLPWHKLTKRKQMVVKLSFGFEGGPPLSKRKLANKLGVSYASISSSLKESLSILKGEAEPSDRDMRIILDERCMEAIARCRRENPKQNPWEDPAVLGILSEARALKFDKAWFRRIKHKGGY